MYVPSPFLRRMTTRFVREIHDIDVASLAAYLNKSEAPFQSSALYSVADEGRFVDETLRLSKFRTFSDAALFGIVRHIVDGISDADPKTTFRLVENDITHIRYETGGFFKPHADYLSLQVGRLGCGRGSVAPS